MKYKLVIFDWDGTLMDSAPRIVSSIQIAAQRVGLPVPDDKQAKNIIGLSLEPAFVTLFGNAYYEHASLLASEYRKAYVENDSTPSPLFTGAIELLAALRQREIMLAVATGKGREGLERVWFNTDSKHFFNTSRCGDEAKSKPHPDMIQQIMSELSVPVHETVMIGDTSYDMEMAETIGMDRIALTHGAHSKHQLQKHSPMAVVDAIADIHQWLY